MRVLIDECLNWRLGRALTGHYSISVQRMGWSGMKDRELMAAAEQNGFDVFLTGDRNLSFEQNVSHFQISVVVIEAPGTQLHQTLPLIPKVLEHLRSIRPGQAVRLTFHFPTLPSALRTLSSRTGLHYSSSVVGRSVTSG